MKLSEVARYWAAKELTRLETAESQALRISAPFACPLFTVRWENAPERPPRLRTREQITALKEVAPGRLEEGTWFRQGSSTTVCFNLPKGVSAIE
jgi:hypothetical protein